MSSTDSASASSSRPQTDAHSKKRVESRQRRRAETNASVYTLRSHTNFTNNNNSGSRIRTAKKLEAWQAEILQRAFTAGVQSPRDKTVTLLAVELGNRTKKQIRDWFSHKRRRVRKSSGQAESDEAESDALEMLLLLRYGTDDAVD